ncbi:exocyst complex component 2-like isoform X3 [Actinia tenebrosa]|nr:exocyst complex component 2-like isoform X3 [Actinia tenebrosa]
MLKDESECDGGSIAETLESILQGASKNADALFQDVLNRKDDADRTRNALNVLQRFRFLFSLPHSIDRNIKQGEYELVISDYSRAKSLFAETDIKIFKKVVQEVETKIESFRNHLKSKLQEFPSPLEEQKKIIRYLVELESGGDPAWDCLVNQHAWLLKLLTSCKNDHQAKDSSPFLQVEGVSDSDHLDSRPSIPGTFRPDSPALGKSMKAPVSKTSNLERQLRSSHVTPQRVQFVEELSDLVTESLPDLWKLGQAYLGQTLLGEDTSISGKQLSPNQDKEMKFQTMIQEVTFLYTDLVNAAFLLNPMNNQNTEELGTWLNNIEGLAAWLPSCVRNVRSCLSSLCSLGLPPSSLNCVRELVDNLRFLCATEVFTEATSEIKTLHCNELWTLEKDENIGRITSLPLLFENIVMETLHTLEEIASESIPEDNKSHGRVKQKGTELFEEMFLTFIECLQFLAFQPEQAQDKISVSSQSDERIDRSTYSLDDNIPVTDERLLIVLNNCRYVREKVLTKLVESFKNQKYPMSDKLTQSLQSELTHLEKNIFDAYIKQKADSLVGSLEPGITAGDFRWYDCLPPNDVRNYVKEILMNLVLVHAQVFSVSSDLLALVLSRLTDLLADEFKRILQKASGSKRNFMSAGAVTAHLEAIAFQQALMAYITPDARTAFTEALELVPPLTKDSDRKLIDALMTSFKRKMALQLQCFHVDMEEI